jgi:O-antigen ligase
MKSNLSYSIIFLFSVVGLAPYIPYFNLVSGFNYGDAVCILLVALFVLNRKINLAIPLYMPAFILSLSFLSILINREDFIHFEESILASLKWGYFQFLALCVTFLVVDEKSGESIFVGILLGIVLSIILTWIEWSVDKPHYYGMPMLHSLNENLSFTINRNYIGFFLSVGVSITFALLLNSSGRLVSILYFLIFLFMFISSFLTFSKGTWVSTLLSIMIIFFVKTNSFIKGTFLLVLLLLIMIFVDKNTSFSEKVESRVASSENTNAQRIDYIVDSFYVILDNPMFGVGPGAYLNATEEYNLNPTTDPHNSILWVISELGVFAGMVYCFVLIWVFYIILVNYKFNNYIWLLCLSVYIPLVLNIPLQGLTVSMKYFWILLGVVVSLKGLRYKTSNE